MKKQYKVHLDEDLKRDADSVLSSMGLSFSTAVGLFLLAVVDEGAIPFQVSAPKARSEAGTKPVYSLLTIRLILTSRLPGIISPDRVPKRDRYGTGMLQSYRLLSKSERFSEVCTWTAMRLKSNS